MHKILVIRLYFPLDALHVPDCISPPTGAPFYKLYVVFGVSRYVWLLCCYRKVLPIATQQPDVPAYTKYDVQLI